MRKLFKSVDQKLEEIGFEKTTDTEYTVRYKRRVDDYGEHCGYTQVLCLLHKARGRHLIQSYDEDLIDGECIGNTCVGLTYYETKLALKKMKQKKWKSK